MSYVTVNSLKILTRSLESTISFLVELSCQLPTLLGYKQYICVFVISVQNQSIKSNNSAKIYPNVFTLRPSW